MNGGRGNTVRRWVWWLGGLVLVGAALGASADELKVSSFFPQGVAREVRQVQAVFSEPVVPLSAGRAAVTPFRSTCADAGQARWLDERTWLVDFPAPLPSGQQCEFVLDPTLRALSGATVSGEATFSFSTGGPVIESVTPYNGSTIEEEPYFKLELSGPVDPNSVEAHVAFVDPAVASPIGVVVVTGRIADEIWGLEQGDLPPTERRLVIKPRLRLAAGSNVELVWGAGVRSPGGVALETEQRFTFTVRGPFTANVSCHRTKQASACIPLRPIRLDFSALVPSELAREVTLQASDGRSWRPDLSELEQNNLSEGLNFIGPFPPSTELTIVYPSNFRDEQGRPLEAGTPRTVLVDAEAPLVKFSAPFGVIERGAPALLPVTVRNVEAPLRGVTATVGPRPVAGFPAQVKRIASVEEILTTLQQLNQLGRQVSMFKDVAPTKLTQLEVPRPQGEAAFEVVGIPFEQPGFYAVEIASERLGQTYIGPDQTFYVRTGALVTDLAVHLKTGAERSLVWVTRLSTGAVVSDATVVLADCTGAVIARGRSDSAGLFSAPGVERLPYERCENRGAQYIAVATLGDDLAFVLSSWTDGIERWRFDLPYGPNTGFTRAHTIFAQSLVRRGDVVKMKHLVRRQSGRGLEALGTEVPDKVRITHYGSGETFEQTISWRKNGSADGEWVVPAGAKLGTYGVALVTTRADKTEETVTSGFFRVESFRLPLMRGLITPSKSHLVATESADVTAAVAYLAGGSARGLPVTVRYRAYRSSYPGFDDLTAFVLANGRAPEGEVNVFREEEDLDSPERAALLSTSAVLDDAGTAGLKLDRLPRHDSLVRVDAELEYRDVAGFVQTVGTRVSVWPADVLLGVQVNWWGKPGPTPVQVVAVSTQGERRAGVGVTLDLLQRKTFTHRKRVVGGFYAYDSRYITERIGTVCSGTTDSAGLFRCSVTPPATGDYYLEARTVDSAGRTSRAHQSFWFNGGTAAWFSGRDDDRVDVIPDKKRYDVGQTARLQVRVPFEQATALVTVEREGVIEAFVRSFDSRDPSVEIPIRPEYAPNVFVSVLAVRGRVGDIMPTAHVDLGRPAFKFGIAPLDVGWQPNELTVTVVPERETYRVREQATVKIRAVTALDGAPAAGAEVALVAIDEGLLELEPNRSWDLLEAMMGARGLDVDTATAQMHVVGRRHFGLKARPDGGGGGKGPTRELFDALLFWNPRVRLDARGEATAQIPLNDSLTSFRIVAVATSGFSRFGTGRATVRSTQELIVVPGFPPTARHGDTMIGTVALRNTTSTALPLEVSLEASDPRIVAAPVQKTLEPGGSTEVTWTINIPTELENVSYTVVARAGSRELDRVTVKQTVASPIPVGVVAASLRQLDSTGLIVPLEFPRGAVPGRGGVRVSVASRIGAGLSGVLSEMRSYPFTCLEQQISKVVALNDESGWRKVREVLPTYLDRLGRLTYFVSEEEGSYELTAYVLGLIAARGWDLPPQVRDPMTSYLRGVASGESDGGGDSSAARMRRIAALDALSRAGEDVTEIVAGLVIDPSVLSTSNLISWFGVLTRTPQAPRREELLSQVKNNLRARLVLSGTELGFSTERADREWWLMSSADLNAVRLLHVLLEAKVWGEDIPRIARGALARQRAGAWDLTTANAWGILAFERFSAQFEKSPVSGDTVVTLGDSERRAAWRKAQSPEPIELEWPATLTDLTVKQQGTGTPWVTIENRAAIPLTEPVAQGYRVTKTLEPVVQRRPNQWSVGDIVRVRLDFVAAVDRTWVVFDDPVPPGAVVLGGGGVGQSIAADTTGARGGDRVSPTFEERTFESYRAYVSYLPEGAGRLEYTLRLNTAGEFSLPDIRAEAMYSPDIFGQTPQPRIRVEP